MSLVKWWNVLSFVPFSPLAELSTLFPPGFTWVLQLLQMKVTATWGQEVRGLYKTSIFSSHDKKIAFYFDMNKVPKCTFSGTLGCFFGRLFIHTIGNEMWETMQANADKLPDTRRRKAPAGLNTEPSYCEMTLLICTVTPPTHTRQIQNQNW